MTETDLNKIELGYSELSQRFYIGIINKNGYEWKIKRDITVELKRLLFNILKEKEIIIQHKCGKQSKIILKEK
ncbi:MAG TPA: hypothetical protein VK982_08250 [Bacteroidales bacterium]|nr:hypothetical protein [Bacteroidales bacterium]